MIVEQILDDAKEILGNCNNATVFKRLTDAVRLANTRITDSANLGVIDICTWQGTITLPADVAQVLASTRNGYPSVLRDQWFHHVVGGPGIVDWVGWGYVDELGRVSTFRDPSGPVKLIAEIESAADAGKCVRIFGWDIDGKRIYTDDGTGKLEDGFLAPTIFGYSAPSPIAPEIVRIDRVEKAVTNGFVKLLAINADGTPHTMIGYYAPWETKPSYRRLKVHDRSWCRIKYRRTDITVRGVRDYINIENPEALMLFLKSVKYRRENQFVIAQSAETEGLRLLQQDKKASEPPSLQPIQIISNEYPFGGSDTLIY